MTLDVKGNLKRILQVWQKLEEDQRKCRSLTECRKHFSARQD